MAKGFGVLLVLFGALVCVHQHHEGVFVVEAGEVAAVAPVLVSSVVYAKPADGYVNAAVRYVNADNGYMNPVVRYINPVYNYIYPTDGYMNPMVRYVNAGGLTEVSARDRLQQIYLAEVGVRELTGRNDGNRVAEYLRYTDLDEGYVWCASFVSWVFGQAGYPEPRTAWSPALFPAKRVIWRRGDEVRPPEPHSGARHLRISSAKPGTDDTNIKDRVSIPQKGDVFGIYFNSVKRIAHAGFVDEWGDKFVITVEGNTNEAGSREGDGVYRKRRLISSIYRVSSWF